MITIGSVLLGLAWASQLASADDPVIGFRIDDSSDNAPSGGHGHQLQRRCVGG